MLLNIANCARRVQALAKLSVDRRKQGSDDFARLIRGVAGDEERLHALAVRQDLAERDGDVHSLLEQLRVLVDVANHRKTALQVLGVVVEDVTFVKETECTTVEAHLVT